MVEKLKSIFRQKELRQKIGFVLLMLLVCRVGAYITVPGINGELILQSFRAATGGGQNLFQFVDMFTGGAFAKMTLVALGVMPFISASIFIQILMSVFPSLQKEIRENGDAGKRKLGKWTRILTLIIALFQSGLYAKQALSFNVATPGVIFSEFVQVTAFGVPWLFFLVTMLSMTTGSLFLMWIGEQITEKGIGNGVSMIISLGILSALPRTLGSILSGLNVDSQDAGQLTITSLIVLSVIFVAIIFGTVMVLQGLRKLPIQYARRSVDGAGSARKTPFIPLKVNFAGIMPVIFASSFLMFPATIALLMKGSPLVTKITGYIAQGTPGYMILFVTLIVLFTFLWTSMQFRPDQIATEMKKSGAFIPGVRQGKPTEDAINYSMKRITWLGAFLLAFIAILPTIVGKLLSVDPTISQFFGGTSILILVGVILDTSKQIESHLIMQKYDGFMSSSKVTGKF
ncbi:MAG: Protein translocase subunit SecY [Chlamydiia bacterium]|nr:Protein translocase subunit SecY [Chlamydiia bacterium]MCH9618498.1 Protein translocase subunit SecY [Chlamydiia bacterium]MCH9623787.1 Protein translocase subunit SecY [Chlamydiia bacterium]